MLRFAASTIWALMLGFGADIRGFLAIDEDTDTYAQSSSQTHSQLCLAGPQDLDLTMLKHMCSVIFGYS